MKCPKCKHNQRYDSAMICNRCGYSFIFNPKESPYISDWEVARHIDDLSRQGNYYFTFDQLVTRVIRGASNASSRFRRFRAGTNGSIASCLGWLAFFVITPLAVLTAFQQGRKGYLWALAITVGAVYFYKNFGAAPNPQKKENKNIYSIAPYTSMLIEKLKKYLTAHPHSHLVDGKRLDYNGTGEYQRELEDYAPERILICEHNELVDMLVLNRFHFENKILVLSASKYPGFIFQYYRQCIKKHPQVPVYLVHDASENGFHMQEALLADREWGLQDKKVVDLGLNASDLAGLYQPVMLPSGQAKFGKVPPHGAPKETPMQFENKRVPLQGLGPKAMMGLFSAAAIGGLPLGSPELYSQRNQFADSIGFG